MKFSACKPSFSVEQGGFGGNPAVADLFQAMSPAKLTKLFEKEFDNSGMDADEQLALSGVVGLLDLMKRRPTNKPASISHSTKNKI